MRGSSRSNGPGRRVPRLVRLLRGRTRFGVDFLAAAGLGIPVTAAASLISGSGASIGRCLWRRSGSRLFRGRGRGCCGRGRGRRRWLRRAGWSSHTPLRRTGGFLQWHHLVFRTDCAGWRDTRSHYRPWRDGPQSRGDSGILRRHGSNRWRRQAGGRLALLSCFASGIQDTLTIGRDARAGARSWLRGSDHARRRGRSDSRC